MSLGEAPTVFERTAPPLLPDWIAFAVSLARNVSDAEDLVQETFLRAQRAFSSFEQGTNAKAWMFTILRRLHIDRHRRARIRPAYLPEEGPEGLSSGAAFRIEAPGSRVFVITVDPLTGRVAEARQDA